MHEELRQFLKCFCSIVSHIFSYASRKLFLLSASTIEITLIITVVAIATIPPCSNRSDNYAVDIIIYFRLILSYC